MESGEDVPSRSNCSSPADPLALLSDCAVGSSYSSWSSEESLSCSSLPPAGKENISFNWTPTSCYNINEINWQRRCTRLQDELCRVRKQTNRVKEILRRKLCELEFRVTQAEARVEDAENKVCLMEDQLHQASDWSSHSTAQSPNFDDVTEQNSDAAITKLACQVEEQRQLRLQDAKFVEAKAARIKEWVTNKLRDLEAQNQHLREQNVKCNQQLELLRRHMAHQLKVGRLTSGEDGNTTPIVVETESELDASSFIVAAGDTSESVQSLVSVEPLYAQIDRQNKKQTSANDSELPSAHCPYLSSTCATSASTSTMTDSFVGDSNFNINTSVLACCHDHPELIHDYAEIYTPSRENVCWTENNVEDGIDKPPTPPLHRFPSWESRIYRVAEEGLLASVTGQGEQNLPISASAQPCTGTGYYDVNCPVYATVKGRASQIRSSPFSNDSSDDSSDEEDAFLGRLTLNSRTTDSSSVDNTDTSISSSSPSKNINQKSGSNLSPLKLDCGVSSSKNISFESGVSDDYAVPPDAVSCGSVGDGDDFDSIDWANLTTVTSPAYRKSNNVTELCLEKCGDLVKLGGKLKTWRKRWFHLSSTGVLRYWQSQNDMLRKPRGEILIDESCKIAKSDAGTTFEIATSKKTYYLTADSVTAVEDWLKALQNVRGTNATKLLLNRENYKPTLQSWITKVRNGHAKKCWCVLVGKTLLYFKSAKESIPLGQINMRDAKVEQVEHVSDSDSDEKDGEEKGVSLTIGIFPSSQPPTYLLMSSKAELDSWLYHLSVVSAGNPHAGTHYEQLVQKLMETEGDASNVLWKHPLLLHSKETNSTVLTTLPSHLESEAIKLFKCCQLFTSVAVDSAGIDYHVVLAQNALQQCLDNHQLATELVCILIKQTSPHTTHKMGVQVLSKLRHRQQLLLCASQSLFACDTTATATASPTVATGPSLVPTAAAVGSIGAPPTLSATNVDCCKANPPIYVFLQGWQLLALVVSLFVPKDHKILWYLKCHIKRNSDTKTECGKYAAYCERALERTIQNGRRTMKPSRMEVLSIILKNPYHHSLPHSIPVHFLNGTYQVVGFDGSTTVTEFLKTLTQDIGCREPSTSGFDLFSDDPIEKELEHRIDPQMKLCDVISKWETALREKGFGKFENTKIIQLVYKNRLYFKNTIKNETEREKLLTCYQTNHQIVNGRFPLSRELALELAALMAQIDLGEFNGEKSGRGSGSAVGTNLPSAAANSKDFLILQALDKFYPYRYRANLSADALRELQRALQVKWQSLKGRSSSDCIRIYLTCARKWPFFGAALFQCKWKQTEPENADETLATMVWLAANEDNISLLELNSMRAIASYPYSRVLTFGGCQEDFMVVISGNDGCSRTRKLLFSLSKLKIAELTLLIADYMNALGTQHGATTATADKVLSRNNIQPDILKTIPDHHHHHTINSRHDSNRYQFETP